MYLKNTKVYKIVKLSQQWKKVPNISEIQKYLSIISKQLNNMKVSTIWKSTFNSSERLCLLCLLVLKSLFKVFFFLWTFLHISITAELCCALLTVKKNRKWTSTCRIIYCHLTPYFHLNYITFYGIFCYCCCRFSHLVFVIFLFSLVLIVNAQQQSNEMRNDATQKLSLENFTTSTWIECGKRKRKHILYVKDTVFYFLSLCLSFYLSLTLWHFHTLNKFFLFFFLTKACCPHMLAIFMACKC